MYRLGGTIYMTVRPTQNSGIPAASSQERLNDITDGTSNTLKTGSQSKPNSKDVFETSGLKAGASEVLLETFTARADAARNSASGLKADSNEVAVEGFTTRGDANHNFMDYTDDWIKKRD
jgi:hypothetical protein